MVVERYEPELPIRKRDIECGGNFARTLGNRRTQMTGVDERLSSFTVFADTPKVPIAKRDWVMVTVRAEKPICLNGPADTMT